MSRRKQHWLPASLILSFVAAAGVLPFHAKADPCSGRQELTLPGIPDRAVLWAIAADTTPKLVRPIIESRIIAQSEKTPNPSSSDYSVVNIQTVGLGAAKSYVLQVAGMGAKNGLIARGGKAGEGVYSGQLVISDSIRASGYVLTNGTFVFAQATDFEFFKFRLSTNTRVSWVIRQNLKLGQSSLGSAPSMALGMQSGLGINGETSLGPAFAQLSGGFDLLNVFPALYYSPTFTASAGVDF